MITNIQPQPLSDDILVGAEAMAKFVFGDSKQRRKIYRLVEKKRLPVFRLGQTICSRKSSILIAMGEQERASITAA